LSTRDISFFTSAVQRDGIEEGNGMLSILERHHWGRFYMMEI